MLLIDPVIARLKSRVTALGSRVEGAAELAALVRDGALPNAMPAGFVLPLGLVGAEPSAAANLYRQGYDDVVGVILVVEAAGDVTGGTALPGLTELVDTTVPAMCGWAPAGASGVFALRRGALISLTQGALIYQLDFGLRNQLRITPT